MIPLSYYLVLSALLFACGVTGFLIKRNMVALPAYSLLLGLLALLGYVALSAGVKPITNQATGRGDSNTIIPVLFGTQFPAWRVLTLVAPDARSMEAFTSLAVKVEPS